MRIFNFLITTIFFFFFSAFLHASCRESAYRNRGDSPDLDAPFLELAAKHPSVGMVVELDCASQDIALKPQEMCHSGSAVLIDCSEISQRFSRRLVLTAAHVVINRETDKPYEKLFFGKTSAERIPVSKVFTHPAYRSEGTLNDLAVLVLKEPASGVPALVGWDVSKEDIQGQDVVHCGFGGVSAINSFASIEHTVPHACYSHVFCPYDDGLYGMHVKSHTITTSDIQGEIISKKDITIERDKASVFHTSPFVDGKVGDVAVECRRLAGTVSNGDSGGGCFLKTGRLVGIHSQRSWDAILAKPDKFFWDPSYLTVYPYLSAHADDLDKKRRFLSVEDAFEEAKYNSNLSKIGCNLSSQSVFLPFHKDWIFSTVKSAAKG